MARMTENDNCATTSCPLKRTLELLEGKYSAYILKELFVGRRRFGELRRSIPNISPKTLSDKLKYYMDREIIERFSYDELPPRVEYQLTDKGRELEEIILSLQTFWEKSG